MDQYKIVSCKLDFKPAAVLYGFVFMTALFIAFQNPKDNVRIILFHFMANSTIS